MPTHFWREDPLFRPIPQWELPLFWPSPTRGAMRTAPSSIVIVIIDETSTPSSENYPPAGWEPRQTGETKSTTPPNHRQSSPYWAIHMLKEQYHVSPHNRIEAWKHAMDKCMSKWAQGRRDMIYSRHETTHNHQSGIIATQPESYPHTLILLSTTPLQLPTKPSKNQMRTNTTPNRPTLLFRQRKRHLTAASRIRHSGSFQRDAAPAR